jgi:hypothetical protein
LAIELAGSRHVFRSLGEGGKSEVRGRHKNTEKLQSEAEIGRAPIGARTLATRPLIFAPLCGHRIGGLVARLWRRRQQAPADPVFATHAAPVLHRGGVAIDRRDRRNQNENVVVKRIERGSMKSKRL